MITVANDSVGARLEEDLRQFCEDAEPHKSIMPERKLAERYGISHGSVRRVLDDLVAAGLIYKVQGKGTFVAEPAEPAAVDQTIIYVDSWHDVGHPHYIRRLQGLTEEAQRHGIRLEMLNCGRQLEQRERLYHDVGRRQVKGVVASWITPQILERISTANPAAKVLVTASRRPPSGVCTILTDHYAMGGEALDYLYPRGCRRPLFIVGSPETPAAAVDPQYEGLSHRVVAVSPQSFDAAALADTIRDTEPDALVFDDDVIAKSVLAVLGRPAIPVVSHYNVGDPEMPDWVIKLQIDGHDIGRLIISTLITNLEQPTSLASTVLVRPALINPD